MLNKVVLPYTIWYTGHEQILRLNLDKDIETVSKLVTEVSLNGGEVNDVVYAVFNQSTKSIDITIRSDARMDVDGEMKISLSYSDTKTHEITLVVMVRSHENTIEEISKEVKQTKLTLLNSQSHTVGDEEEPVVYSFDLVNRDVTNEFATYGDIKDMLANIGVTDAGQKDQYTILLEGDNLVLTKENDDTYRKEINLAKYHDEVSGEPLNVEDLKRDILSIVDGKIPNVETLKSDILSEAATKDAQLKVDILHEVDGKIPNANTIKQDILADVNPRIPDKETLKTEILESAGEKDTTLKTAILEEVATRTTQNNQSLKQEIMGEVDGKLPNTAVLKENILGEVDTKITTNNQTLKSTVMSEVDAKIPDVSGIKSEILNEVNPRLLDKETLKQEILSALPTPDKYTLTMDGDNLVLGKENDWTYRKAINLAKYHDEVTGQTVDVAQIKNDILSSIRIPKYKLTLDNDTLSFVSQGGWSEGTTTIDLSKYKDAVDTDKLKKDILAEVNPKLIDKDTFKQEILSALPAKDEYSLELTEDILVLTKTNDSSYRKEINLSKYHDEVGQPINVESLKSDILSQVDTKILAIPPHTVTSTEVITALNAAEQHDIESLSDTIIQNIGDLTFHKETDKYVVKYKPNGTDDDHAVEMVEIPFTSLREIPTATQAEPVTLEKIFELMNDNSKENILNSIRNKLEIPEPLNPNKLISDPIVANGVLKFNTETDAPTVDFTNDFYTKAKVDELLRSSSGSNTPNDNKLISGSGRPDATDHPNHNASVGTIFVDVNTTHGASIWYKDKTNTWKVIVGDTGWYKIKTINLYDRSEISIRRINDIVYLKFGGLTYGLFGHIPYGKMTSKKEKNKIFRIVDISDIPIGFRSDDAYIGSIISDVESPGSIVASYYVGGQSDSNFIKVLYNNTIPEKDVKDLRPQPGSWPIGNNQSWPKI